MPDPTQSHQAIKYAEDRYDVAQAAFNERRSQENAEALDRARDSLYRARQRAIR